MLLVAPGPASASTAASNIRPPRRQSTATNFAGLAPATRALAFGFQALASPRARSSVPATVVVCALLELMVSAPYAANQWAANGSPAIRGLILGSFAYFSVGPMILVVEPTLVSESGNFRRFPAAVLALAADHTQHCRLCERHPCGWLDTRCYSNLFAHPRS